MLSNCLTLMIIPQKNSRILSFRISYFFSKILLVVFILFFLFSSFVLFDYIRIKEKGVSQGKLYRAISFQKFKLTSIQNLVSDERDKLVRLEKFEKKLRLIAGLEESTSRIRYVGGNHIGESDKKDIGAAVLDSLDKLALDMKLTEINFFQLEADLQEREDQLARTPSVAPTTGYISSPFGKRIDPFTGKVRFHKGLDFSNRPFTPIYAPADGVVVNTEVNGAFGEFLVIDHGYEVVTRYGHLAKYEVKVGQQVKRGDLIARMGNTGRSTANHLHYEVLVRDQNVDPEKYILQ